MATAAGLIIGGLGSYFGGKAQESGARTSADVSRAQIEENKRQADLNEAFRREKLEAELQAQRDAAAERQATVERGLATKRAASRAISGDYDTSGYEGSLNYVDPYATSVSSAIDTLLKGGLTEAEQAQQSQAISKSQQQIGAGAATMGLPAGARAALSGQSMSDILRNYAVMGSGRVSQGISAAGSAARTGADIAGMNYRAGLQNFLNEQAARNRKAELEASYATPLPSATPADMTRYNTELTRMKDISNI